MGFLQSLIIVLTSVLCTALSFPRGPLVNAVPSRGGVFLLSSVPLGGGLQGIPCWNAHQSLKERGRAHVHPFPWPPAPLGPLPSAWQQRTHKAGDQVADAISEETHSTRGQWTCWLLSTVLHHIQKKLQGTGLLGRGPLQHVPCHLLVPLLRSKHLQYARPFWALDIYG